MKLANQILLLFLVVTTALSSTFSDISFNINFNAMQIAPECQRDIDEYKPCFTLFNYSNKTNITKEACNVIYNEQCQEFYEEPFYFMPNCIDYHDIEEVLDHSVINIILSRVNSGCKTDENGKLCPIANTYSNGESISQTYGALFEATCKSPKCTTALIDILTGELKYAAAAEALSITSGNLDASTTSVMKRLLEDLNSDKCSIGNSEINNMKNSNEESDFVPIKIKNTLIVITLFLTFTLLF
ncbi:hypothetical protein BCR36DRAFT_580035 [Piromyces finnis]|uniref:Uncharacterized protein n=1 Tax=Piromyces finnis TaxID=1754191 RepID=A0A1Y1VJZ6_9FUNG|nr:hypothetical protein BCR36DRAFT_580035 [Piromyces finnis]|eukprot:ORX58411.1 hypothetical protein BCR36DRAFT_580035 [Piromyces finnis]